ncbi:electron transfer flavoprotein subunit beta/FixA family protein [Diplocloster modestus]|uniref:Electron transfer flavoprotein small subunit n=1 Tax=Diplocloster modestus TaxID=2850322 RepID=A0ABS6K1I6_9FIRM|nr:electron transfer flavoprotein subunit beta/FixA family protein [Diplocloster modestus]MBU9724721.1 electron transfer flavoprotein subunit beta/FixA family protein [Diplocloster modestus]
MNIVVCVKQVPGTASVDVDPVTGILKRDGIPSKMNPYDLYALELALTLASGTGGTVRTISMGPPQAQDMLAETLFMGADSAVLLSDRRFAGADVSATAYTLSQALPMIGNYDLILCGKQTTDGDTAQVGAELAEFLNIPHAGYVVEITDITDKGLVIRSNMEDSIQTEYLPLPCLICTDSRINTPRLPSYKKKKSLGNIDERIQILTLADFQDKDETHYGLAGSPTQVERIFPPAKNEEKVIYRSFGEPMAQQLFTLLSRLKFI